MPFIVTPHQLNQRAELYHQLASLTEAGIGLPQALHHLSIHPPSAAFRKPLASLLASLAGGFTFADALKASGDWVPEFDIALLQAGEQSGRLDGCFKLLSGYYRDRAQLAREVISNLAYPVLVFHFAFLIFPVSLLQNLVWKGDVISFIRAKGFFFLPLYTLVGFILYACQGKRGERARAVVESVVRRIPVIGSARQNLALARLSAALEALINAGVSIIPAWELAGEASGSPALAREVRRWKPILESREQTPSDLLRNSRVFPDMFANLYYTGEISGQQDDTLRRLYAYYQEEGSRKLKLFVQWTPRAVYFLIVLLVAYQILSFYQGYFNQVNSVLP